MHKNKPVNFAPAKQQKMRKRTRKSPKKAKLGAFWVLEGMGTVVGRCERMGKPGNRAEGLVSPAGSGGSRQSATGARSPLGTRFWSGCGNSAQRAGEGQGCAVLPAKSQNGRCWFGAVRKNEWIERASAICHRMIASICDLYYNITKQDRLAYVERISCELLLRILRALPMFQRME